MPSARLATSSWRTLWWCCFLAVQAVWQLARSETIACGDVGCTCDDAARLLSCVGLNLSFVPDVSSVRVHSLDLSDNAIREVGDDDLVRFSELRFLDLSRNNLSKISTNAFRANVRLCRLVLDDNNLNSADIMPASGAPLRELYLSGNRIDDLDRLTVFSSLSTLDVSDTALVWVPGAFLVALPRLQRFIAARNRIEEFAANVVGSGDRIQLRKLNLSSNSLVRFSIAGQLRNLEVLDLSWNRLTVLDADSLAGLPNLLRLVLSGNPIGVVPDSAFRFLTSLRDIEMNFLQNLTSISDGVFAGLPSLRRLRLAHNSRLGHIDSLAFTNLYQLRIIDLSYNNLSSFESVVFLAERQLEELDLSGNPWPCDCVAYGELLALETTCSNASCALQVEPVCWNATGESIANTSSGPLDCRKPRVLTHTRDARHGLGSSAVLDCRTSGLPPPQVVWVTNRNLMITYSKALDVAPVRGIFFSDVGDSYLYGYEEHNRMLVLRNGSLYIAYVTRKEAGTYRCVAANEYGNDTAVVEFQLNYQVMSTVTVHSIIVGFLTAAGFFLLAVVIGVVRYLSFVCSRKERKKRKSIREVLETIHDYKLAQFDKLSAYKTAKMDQLTAFKSAKIDQFSAFRHSRIDKLRTYKQATVTSVLQYLERMREHYTNQTVRIKDNCAQQMDKLRESYGERRGRFKDYRSHQVERMRDNYNAQVVKIRDYGVQQMFRLREQYKAQQQNMLKLLELLDIGNCVTVIEAECMHTESVIFDASIAFDFEAHPIHVPRGGDADYDSSLSDESHYLTASESGSETDLAANPRSLSFAAEVEPDFPDSLTFPDFLPMDGLGDSNSDIFLESFPIDPMEFPEMPDIPGILIPGRREDLAPSERETEC